MPTSTFSIAASGKDGYNSRTGDNNQWDVGTITTDTTNAQVAARKVRHLTFAFYEIICGHLVFDTSSLPDDAVVTAAVLRIKVAGKSTAESRTLDLEWYAHGAAIDSADYTATVGTTAATVAAATWQAWADASTQDITLSNPAANVSKTGETGIRIGISGGQPPAGGNFDTALYFYAFDHASEPEPQLLVTYTEARPFVNVTIRPGAA